MSNPGNNQFFDISLFLIFANSTVLGAGVAQKIVIAYSSLGGRTFASLGENILL